MFNVLAKTGGRQPFIRQGEHYIDDESQIAFWRIDSNAKWLVFLHGNSACKEVFNPQMTYFANQGYSVLAIDLPGHGASQNAADAQKQYTIPGYAETVITLLNKLHISKPAFIGWSLGGHIGLEMMGQGFVFSSISICGTPPIAPGLEDFSAAFLATEAAAVTTQSEATEEQIKTYIAALYGTLEHVPDFFLEMGLRCHGIAREIMGAHWAQGNEGYCEKTLVANCKIPLQVMLGEKDMFINSEYLQKLIWKNLYTNQIIRLSGLGHAPFIEDPIRFNQHLSAFLKACQYEN